jgi:hypothetical protein
MLSQRKKRPSIHRTRLRFGRREPQPVPPRFPPHYCQTWESMDLSEYDDDLIELKRRAEANGHYLQIPKRGPGPELPEPIDFGESLSDIVIRQRGREPER